MIFTLDNVDRINENILIQLLASQTLFKCLKFTSSDALTKADLTDNEKKILFNQDGDTTNSRIFYTPFNLNIEDSARAEVRIFVLRFKPDNIQISNIEVMIQVISDNRMVRLDTGRNRLLVMVSEILKSLNGFDIGFIGKSYFDTNIQIIRPDVRFTGYELVLKTRTT